MNIFIIPSWYPSPANPLNGVFIQEQVMWIAEYYPDLNFGISLWGQNDENYLLHARQPLRSLKKLRAKSHAEDKPLRENVTEYFSPAYSHTDLIKQGNITGKIKACLENLNRFKKQFGKVNIIHAHVGYPSGYIAAQLKEITGIPYIITEHMGPFPQLSHQTRTGALKPRVKEAYANARQVIAVSHALKNSMIETGIQQDITVLPNFTNLSLPQVSPSDTFTYCTLSGLVENKGLEELLKAIQLSLQKDKHLKFLIVGDGPLREQLKQQAAALQINDHVTFAGFQSRETIPTCLAKSHAHILTSHYESFGVAYIEAMAMGLPNIAAAIGGPLDIIDDNTGVLVDEITPEAITEKILWMKANYDQFDPAIIRISYEQRFSVAAIVPKIIALYKK